LFFKDKVEVLDEWIDYTVRWGKGDMYMPATIRMKYYVPRHMKKRRCNRTGILKRDRYVCQYCGKADHPSNLTIDHIKPRCDGGITSWDNCVTACFSCNNKKGDRSLKQSGMKLTKKPSTPLVTVKCEYQVIPPEYKHISWSDYIV
jgi:5-methylcytosine-specific restriction endonuclease McrA